MTPRTTPSACRLVVTPEHDGARLDVFLAATTSLSRRAARALIATGEVLRNGSPVRVLSKTLATGDVVDALRPPSELGVPAMPTFHLPDILFADGWIVAVDKPAGVLSQPADGAADGDLPVDVQLLLGLAVRDGRRPFLRLVHRLDRATSGVVLFARNPQATAPLAAAWQSGDVDRRYLAVVAGHPELDRIDIDRPIGRDASHRWRFRIDHEGRPATTAIEVVERLPADRTLVECRLGTGRTHQVRVHLAAIGTPVVGDVLYGAPPDPLAARPLLHGWRLELPHPKTGGRVRIESPIPSDIRGYLEAIRQGTKRGESS